MMANQNRNTIDGFEKTEANNNSPEDLCFDPSDASITSSSDKSIPNNVLDVLVKLGDKRLTMLLNLLLILIMQIKVKLS